MNLKGVPRLTIHLELADSKLSRTKARNSIRVAQSRVEVAINGVIKINLLDAFASAA